MKNEVLVKVEGVSKKFCRDLKKSLWYGFKDIIGEVLLKKNSNSKLRTKEFLSLNDVSFEVKRGEVLGLIGHNGAGKTTLLKVLNGLIKPDAGKVIMHGRVNALIALGAGFNPILTGRENIYINGAVLGLSKKEVDEKFDEIVNFADLWEFIDTPVQSYSSGMHVRLGFAIASNLNPDILLIDEILAVGDVSFRNKCYSQLSKIAKNAAVIFISHSMNDIVRICDKCIVLNRGVGTYYDNVSDGVKHYLTSLSDNTKEEESFVNIEYPVHKVDFKWENLNINYGDFINLIIEIDMIEDVSNASFQIPIYDNSSLVAGEWYSLRYNQTVDLFKGKNIVRIQLGPIFLKNGTYKIGIVMTDSTGIGFSIWSYKSHTLKVSGPILGGWPFQIKGTID